MELHTDAQDPDHSASSESGRIDSSTRKALSSFEYLKAIRNDATILWWSRVIDSEAKFRIWAGNIGAYHSPLDAKSADAKLRNASHVRARVLRLLADVVETNEEILQIMAGQRVEETQEPSSDEFPETKEPQSEMEELFLSLDDVLNGLMKVSVLIRSFAGRNRAEYARAMSRKTPMLTQFDIAHVVQKHPKLERSFELRRRMGEAITQRRGFLTYAREHHQRIAHNPLNVDANAKPQGVPDHEYQSMPEPTDHDTTYSRPTLAPTINTSLWSADVPEGALAAMDDYGAQHAASEVSPFASRIKADETEAGSDVVDLNTLREPGKAFQCPYCYGMVLFASKRAWRKHVLADLRAYVCTNTACTEGLFETKASWINHEEAVHRRRWLCPQCPGVISDKSRAHIIAHMESRHQLRVSRNNLEEDFIAIASFPKQDLAPTDCCFCDEWDELLRAERLSRDGTPCASTLLVPARDFYEHVARHLEKLALFAITPTTEGDDDEGEEIAARNKYDNDSDKVSAGHTSRADSLDSIREFDFEAHRENLEVTQVRDHTVSQVQHNLSPPSSEGLHREVQSPLEPPSTGGLTSASRHGLEVESKDESGPPGHVERLGLRGHDLDASQDGFPSLTIAVHSGPGPDNVNFGINQPKTLVSSKVSKPYIAPAKSSPQRPDERPSHLQRQGYDAAASRGSHIEEVVSIEPSCAICGAPPFPECQHEGERLELALNQAMKRWGDLPQVRFVLSRARYTIDRLTATKKFVLDHARESTIATFRALRSVRMEAHHNYLQTLPYYTLYYRYGGHPPLNPKELTLIEAQIQRANQILQQGVDQDWRTSVLRYPQVLDYYFSLVQITLPAANDLRLTDPRFGESSVSRHSVKEGGNARDVAEPASSAPQTRQRLKKPRAGEHHALLPVPCKFFLQGKCQADRKCRFSHDVESTGRPQT